MSDPETIQAVANQDTSFVVSFIAENWLNIIFGLIGAVGTLYGALSWKSSQKEKRSYKFLFELAEKNIEKDITEASLKKKKEEVERATSEIENLQEQIKRDIPKEARKAVLKDKLNSHYIELTNTYKNICLIKDELSHISESNEIPPDLLKEIEKEISPGYLLKEERENLKTYLTVFTTLAAITSTVLPWEISSIVAGVFLIAGLVILIQLIRNIFKGTTRKNQIRIATYGYIIGYATAAILSAWLLYVYAEWGSGWRVETETYVLMSILGFFATVTFIVSTKLQQLKHRYVDIHVNE